MLGQLHVQMKLEGDLACIGLEGKGGRYLLYGSHQLKVVSLSPILVQGFLDKRVDFIVYDRAYIYSPPYYSFRTLYRIEGAKVVSRMSS